MKWPLVKLGNMCDLQNGFAFSSDDYIESSNTFNCRMSNIRPNGSFDILYNPKYLPDEYVEKYKNYILKDGDIIIAMTDMANDPKILGVPTIVDTKGFNLLLNQRVGKLFNIDSNKLHIPFLKIVLSSPTYKKYYKNFSGGGLQLNISKEHILNIQIPLPPLPDQIRIAEILSKAEALIAQRKESIRLSDELIKSTFLEMFGDPVKNEKGWEIILFEKILSSNPQIGTIQPAKEIGQQLVVRVGELGDKKVNFKKSKYVTLEKQELEKYLLKTGDLLLARAIGSEEHLGKASLFYEIDESVVYDSHVMRLRFDKLKVIPEFVYNWLKSKGGREQFMAQAGRTSVQFNINSKQIQKIQIPIPPIALQNKFAQTVEKIESVKRKYEEGLKELENLYHSLSQRAFKGEL